MIKKIIQTYTVLIACIFLLSLRSNVFAQNCDVNPPPGVDSADIQAIIYASNLGYNPRFDINGDGLVNRTDADICRPQIGQSNPGNAPQFALPDSPTKNAPPTHPFSAGSFITDIVGAFLPIILSIAGFLTVILIIVSGIQFVTSSGNPESAAAARGRLTFAIIGFVIIVLAFAITQIVARIFLGSGV